MLPALCLHVLATDAHQSNAQDNTVAMQEALMRHFYPSTAARSFYEYISFHQPSSPMCGGSGRQPWRGLECTQNSITRVTYEYVRQPNLRIEYLPPSVQYANVQYNAIEGTLCARRLPRGLVDIDISSNQYTGSVNIRDLPRTLENFLAKYNEFSHVLFLIDLPPQIVKVDFTANKLSMGRVYFGEIPESLCTLSLWDNPSVRLRPLPETKPDTERYTFSDGSIWFKDGPIGSQS